MKNEDGDVDDMETMEDTENYIKTSEYMRRRTRMKDNIEREHHGKILPAAG